MGLSLMSALVFGLPAAYAQAPAIDPIDDDFDEENPCESDTWLCLGQNWTSVWVSPDSDYCFDDPNNPSADPLQPDTICTLYEGEGYVLVTNGALNRGGPEPSPAASKASARATPVIDRPPIRWRMSHPVRARTPTRSCGQVQPDAACRRKKNARRPP